MSGLRDAFRGIRGALEFAQVGYAIGGSWASTSYGEPRQTNDVDLLAAFTPGSLKIFLEALGSDYYFDEETALEALRLGRPFNVIHRRFAFKFDLFPVRDEHGAAELERRRSVAVESLDDNPVPIVTAEDIVLAKLRWYRAGGETSEQQWRDLVGVLRSERARLDERYLDDWARRLGVDDLLVRARVAALPQ